MKAIVSEYAGDADLAPIIKEFVSCLPERTKAMRDRFLSGNFPDLERLAHQLKGAGGSYGYPMLTEVAGSLEDTSRVGDRDGAQKVLGDLEKMCEAIAEGMRVSVEAGRV